MKKINQKNTRRTKLSAFALVCLVLITVFSIMPFSAYAETTVPDATSQFYVNDFADVFTPEEESRLMDTAVALAEEYNGIQVVVTTIESLGGDTIENYAVNMYNKYGIGKNDMGLLILLSTGDREIWVTTGLAMEAYFPDSKVGRFIDDYAIPSLRKNEFNIGLINLQEAVIKEIISCVEKESATVATVPKETVEAITKEDANSIPILVLSIAFFFVFAVIITVVACKAMFEKKLQTEVALLKNENSHLKECYENASIRMSNRHSNEINRLNEMIQSLKSKHSDKIDQLNGVIQSLKSEHSDKIDQLNEVIQTLKSEKSEISSSYDSLLQKYNTLQDRYKRAQTLHPNIDGEVSNMIQEEIKQKDIAAAQVVDTALNEVINLTASKDIVDQVYRALSKYSGLTSSQKSYVTSNVTKVKALYEASLKLQKEYEKKLEKERQQKAAATALATITSIITCIEVGKAKDLNSLRRAKSIYDNLDYGSQRFFDSNTRTKLEHLFNEAESDQRRLDEEERRQREEERRRQQREEEERRRRQREEEERRRRQREEEERRRRQREEEERRRRQREEEERRRRQREEEERRRRMQSSSFSHRHSSFGSSSSHHGFGGRSGGGGAGRGF